MSGGPEPVVLVTGAPRSSLARRLVATLAARASGHAVAALVPAADRARAEAWLRGAGLTGRVTVREGDPWRIDLGLAGADFLGLAERLAVVHHVAVPPPAGGPAATSAAPVDAARELLELADASPGLERLVLWSSVHVSGRREGRVLETDADPRAGFHGERDRDLSRAEALLRRARVRYPVTILRPGVLAWDAAGRTLDDEGIAYLLVLLLLEAPPELRLPLPGHGATPLHLVPVDYVVDGGLALAAHPDAVGRTFHLVDAAAPPAREVYERICRAAGRPPPRGFVPASLAKALSRHPVLQRLDRPARGSLDQLATDVTYDDRDARALLGPRGLTCPPLSSWVGDMVAHVRDREARRRG